MTDDGKIEANLKQGAQSVSPRDLDSVIKQQNKIEQVVQTKSSLKQFLGDIQLLFSLLKDYASGRYRAVPWWSIAAITTSLLYVLNPFDLIHDLIPIVGLGDDALFLAACLKMVQEDLNAYKIWKAQKDTAPADGGNSNNDKN